MRTLKTVYEIRFGIDETGLLNHSLLNRYSLIPVFLALSLSVCDRKPGHHLRCGKNRSRHPVPASNGPWRGEVLLLNIGVAS